MATLTREIKDEHIIPLYRAAMRQTGNYFENEVTQEEALAFLQAKADAPIDTLYNSIIQEDVEVVAKRQEVEIKTAELTSLLNTKLAEVQFSK